MTAVPAKAALMGRQRATVRAWRDVCRTWPGAVDRGRRLHRLALVLVKPEAVAARVGPRLVEAIRGQGYATVAHCRVRLGAGTTRELWRYHFTGALPDRQRFIVRVMGAGDSLLLLLRRDAADPVPASTSLTVLKGPTLPAGRRPWHLRSHLPVHRTGLFNCVHTADEPIDVVRELGLLLTGAQRVTMLAAATAGRDGTAAALADLADMHAGTDRTDLDFDLARERLTAALPDHRTGPARELAALLGTAQRHRPGPWERLPGLAERCGVRARTGEWDLLTVAANLVTPRIDAPEPFPAAADLARAWRTHHQEGSGCLTGTR